MNKLDYQELTPEEKDAIMQLAETKAKSRRMPALETPIVQNVSQEVKLDDPELLKIIEKAQAKQRVNEFIKNKIKREAKLDAKLGRFEGE